MWRARVPMILLAAVLSAIIYNFATIKPEGAKMQETQPAPDFTLKTADGKPPYTKAILKGKVIILDFWATWCGPCRESIPELARLTEKYGDKGLQVIGISTDDKRTRAQVPAAIKALGINYPVVFASDSPDIAASYPTQALPTMFILDRKGNLRGAQTGYDPSGRWEERIEVLLNEQ